MRENPSLKQQAIGACEETRSQWRDRTHPVRGQFPTESEQPLAESEESLILASTAYSHTPSQCLTIVRPFLHPLMLTLLSFLTVLIFSCCAKCLQPST